MTLRGGLDLGGTKIEALVVDEAQAILGQARRVTPTARCTRATLPACGSSPAVT